MTLNTPFIENNGVATHFGVTPLFAIRAVLIAGVSAVLSLTLGGNGSLPMVCVKQWLWLI